MLTTQYCFQGGLESGFFEKNIRCDIDWGDGQVDQNEQLKDTVSYFSHDYLQVRYVKIIIVLLVCLFVCLFVAVCSTSEVISRFIYLFCMRFLVLAF